MSSRQVNQTLKLKFLPLVEWKHGLYIMDQPYFPAIFIAYWQKQNQNEAKLSFSYTFYVVNVVPFILHFDIVKTLQNSKIYSGNRHNVFQDITKSSPKTIEVNNLIYSS